MIKELKLELKSSTITNAIIQQVTYYDLREYFKLEKHEIVGWFRLNNNSSKIVVSYKDGLMTQSPYIKNTKKLDLIKLTEENINFYLDIYNYGLNNQSINVNLNKFLIILNHKNYIFDTEPEANDFLNSCIDYQSKVEKKGQFYIL